MSRQSKKTTGWAAAYCTNNQIHLIFVYAPTKEIAIEKFEIMECKIRNPEQVRRVCIVTYPGPTVVQQLPESNWEAKSQMIKEGQEQ